MADRPTVDELRGDTKPTARLSDTALEDIGDVQLPGGLDDLDGSTLEREGGISL